MGHGCGWEANRTARATVVSMTRQEDWIKTLSWDVRNPDGTQVTTLTDLCDGDVTYEKVRGWVTLPAWEPAPTELKLAALKYLDENMPTPTPLEDIQ